MTDENKKAAAAWIAGSPRGEEMPIGCTYDFSYGKAIWDRDDIPQDWNVVLLANDDPRVSDFPVSKMPLFTDQHGNVLHLAFLENHQGEMVATWDEGRWWTPEESEAWTLMLAVPGAFAVAQGAAEQSLPRWYRRRKNRGR